MNQCPTCYDDIEDSAINCKCGLSYHSGCYKDGCLLCKAGGTKTESIGDLVIYEKTLPSQHQTLDRLTDEYIKNSWLTTKSDRIDNLNEIKKNIGACLENLPLLTKIVCDSYLNELNKEMNKIAIKYNNTLLTTIIGAPLMLGSTFGTALLSSYLAYWFFGDSTLILVGSNLGLFLGFSGGIYQHNKFVYSHYSKEIQQDFQNKLTELKQKYTPLLEAVEGKLNEKQS